jgi:hypothetical protein
MQLSSTRLRDDEESRSTGGALLARSLAVRRLYSGHCLRRVLTSTAPDAGRAGSGQPAFAAAPVHGGPGSATNSHACTGAGHHKCAVHSAPDVPFFVSPYLQGSAIHTKFSRSKHFFPLIEQKKKKQMATKEAYIGVVRPPYYPSGHIIWSTIYQGAG